MCELCQKAKAGGELTLAEAKRLMASSVENLSNSVASKLEEAGVEPEQFLSPDEFRRLLLAFADAYFVVRAMNLGLVKAVAVQAVEGGAGGFSLSVQGDEKHGMVS